MATGNNHAKRVRALATALEAEYGVRTEVGYDGKTLGDQLEQRCRHYARAAVEDGQAALTTLLNRLTDVPTPAGRTPRQTGVLPSATLLPIMDVRQGKNG